MTVKLTVVPFWALASLRQLQHLMRQFHHRIASEFGRSAGMRGAALDLDLDGARALAPDGDAVAGAAGFEIERDVVLLGKLLDQRARAARAGFLVGVEKHRDARIVLELQILQDVQHRNRDDDAGLVVRHAGAMGAAALDAERARGGRPLGEHRVHVRHQQHLAFAGAVEGRDDVVARGRGGGDGLDRRAELLQLLGGDGADRFHSLGVAGAGIDVDQPLPELDRAGLVLFRAVEDRLDRFGGHRRRDRNKRHKCQRGKPAKHHRPPVARSGNAVLKPSRDAFSTPRSVISPVTSRAGVTSKA